MLDTSIDDLKALHRKARAARYRFEGDWYLNIAFFEGEHWLGWDGKKLFRPAMRSDRVLITDNRIGPIIRTEVAKLSKYRPTYVAKPRTGGDDDLAAAEMSQQVLEFLWTHLKMQEHYARALLWSRVCCAGFLKIVWDRTLGDGTEVLVGQDGSPILDAAKRPMRPVEGLDLEQLAQQIGAAPGAVQRKTVNRGDINVVVRSPFEIYPDPLAEQFSDVEWLIEETVLSEEYVLNRFGVRIAADTPANPGMVQSSLFAGATVAAGTQSGGYKGVKVCEYWRKPCSDHPRGYRVVWAGDKIIDTDDAPADPMPYLMLSGIPVPGRLWPTSVAEQLRDPQMELNKVKSQLAENRNRVGNATLLVAQGGVDDQDEFERQISAPGGVAYYNPAGGQGNVPGYLQAPQMPGYVPQEIDRIEASLQEISGQHEVSSAQVPAGVTAASAINLLQEADDTRLGPSVTDLEGQLSEAGRKQLALVARFYDDQRTVALMSDDDSWEIFSFRGEMLRGHTHVEVQAGSMFPRSLAAKQAAMESTLTVFLQNGRALKDQDLAKFLRDYQVGGVEHLVAEFSRDQAQIGRENRRLMQGVPLAINDFDNDDAHVTGHQDTQKSAKYERLPEPVKAVLAAHVKAHLDRLRAKQQQQPAPAAGPEPPGAPPPDGPPPPAP